MKRQISDQEPIRINLEDTFEGSIADLEGQSDREEEDDIEIDGEGETEEGDHSQISALTSEGWNFRGTSAYTTTIHGKPKATSQNPLKLSVKKST